MPASAHTALWAHSELPIIMAQAFYFSIILRLHQQLQAAGFL